MTYFGNRQFPGKFAISLVVALAACSTVPESNTPVTATKPEKIVKTTSPEHQFDAVLGVIANVPETARTAKPLGTRRLGSGVLIDADGLILTIGYLIIEATSAAIIGPDGEKIAADIIAFDPESGLGLLRARGPINATPMELGSSRDLNAGTPVLAVSHGSGTAVLATRIVSRRPFAGYWEYLLDRAIFTAPPLREYGGAALINGNGRLVGIGSLMVNDAMPGHASMFGNMFVPVDLLRPVINELVRNGRRSAAGAPWLGVRIDQAEGRVFITRLTLNGPGEKAGLQPGDIIIGVNGRRVRDMEDYLRKVRKHGRAGDDIPLDVLPRAATGLIIQRVVVRSMDRIDWLRN